MRAVDLSENRSNIKEVEGRTGFEPAYTILRDRHVAILPPPLCTLRFFDHHPLRYTSYVTTSSCVNDKNRVSH